MAGDASVICREDTTGASKRVRQIRDPCGARSTGSRDPIPARRDRSPPLAAERPKCSSPNISINGATVPRPATARQQTARSQCGAVQTESVGSVGLRAPTWNLASPPDRSGETIEAEPTGRPATREPELEPAHCRRPARSDPQVTVISFATRRPL